MIQSKTFLFTTSSKMADVMADVITNDHDMA